MEYKYDSETDILTISFSSDEPDFGEQNNEIITHYNKEGKVVEIEILDASRTAAKIIEIMLKAKRDVLKK